MVITDTCTSLDTVRRRATIAPVGEIDAGSVADLVASVHRALLDGVHELDVDLRGVTFMDTAALAVLEHAREDLESTGGVLCIRNARPPVARLLALTAFVPTERIA